MKPEEKFAEEASQDHASEPNMTATFRSSYKNGYLAGFQKATVLRDERVDDILQYCIPHRQKMWAASIISKMLKCDFRDTDAAIKNYYADKSKESAP